jgi:hypothetical protein
VQMRRRSDTPHGVAQMLLQDIIAKIHEHI